MQSTYHKILGIALLHLCILSVMAQQEAQQVSQVRVITDPPGCVLVCDGVMKDETPITLTNLKPGTHLLEARKQGYRAARCSITVTANQRRVVEMPALEPIHGLVLLHSEPSGAQVEIDGADYGRTPALVTDVQLGKHRVRFDYAGHQPKEVDLVVKDRIPTSISVTLESDSATLTVTSKPNGADVLVNGIVKGKTPCTISSIPEGDSTLKLDLAGYESYGQTLKLRAGQRETVTAVLIAIPAELKVVSIPARARIYINDQFHGEAPVTLTDLEPGTYRLRAELKAYEPMRREVVLREAQKIVEEFRLNRDCGTLEISTEPAHVLVLIDGRERGSTIAKEGETDQVSEPLQIDLLSIGTHDVQLSKKGFFGKKFTVGIQKNKTETLHHRLKRRFIPDCEVTTSLDVFRGVVIDESPSGDIKLELRPGIFKTIPANDVIRRRPIRTE